MNSRYQFGGGFIGDYTGNLHDGFRLESSNMNAIAGNRANNNLGSGFLLASSSGNIVGLNVANGNGAYGFALVSSSNNNQVISNSACGNATFDAYQETTSTGNVYRKNAFLHDQRSTAKILGTRPSLRFCHYSRAGRNRTFVSMEIMKLGRRGAMSEGIGYWC